MDNREKFDQRIGGLKRQHSAMANGYTTVMQSDGLIVAKPKRRRRRGVPLKLILLLALGFFAFKGFMVASLGELTYNERVAKLGNGTPVEQGGAWVMQSDPVTMFLAGFFETLT